MAEYYKYDLDLMNPKYAYRKFWQNRLPFTINNTSEAVNIPNLTLIKLFLSSFINFKERDIMSSNALLLKL